MTRLAEGAVEIPLISTITGHSHQTVETIIERYMVRTSQMARVAFGKRIEAEELSGRAERGLNCQSLTVV